MLKWVKLCLDMALLTAKQNPEQFFLDFDVTQEAGDAAIASYTRVTTQTAYITLKSIQGVEYRLTLDGSNLPPTGQLTTSALSLFASFNKLRLSPANDLQNVNFSWDGQGSSIGLTALGNALNSGNSAQVLNLFLGGIDTLLASYQDVDISALPELENVTLEPGFANVIGNISANTLIGNNLNNFFNGKDGNDIVRGFDGDDTALGGNGNDSLFGGNGDDQLNGALLNDFFDGGDGNDFVRGGNGRDTLTGGVGRDELWGDFGRNNFANNRDQASDLLVIKSDQLMFNALLDKVDVESAGTKCDIIGAIDTIDQIIIQGVTTAGLSFKENFTWKDVNNGGSTFTGTAIFALGKLEALYTDGQLSLSELQAITTGDASPQALNNTKDFYGLG